MFDSIHNIKENRNYDFYGYELKLYDFEKMNTKDVKITKQQIKEMRGSMREACHWAIKVDYVQKDIESADKIILLTFDNEGDKYVDTYVSVKKLDKHNYYTGLSCSRKCEEYKLGLGTLLRYIMFVYLKNNNIVNIYNHASNYDLLSYYNNFGYKLSSDLKNLKLKETILNDEGLNDLNMYLNIVSENDVSRFKTDVGYEMKLSDINKNGLSKLKQYFDRKRKHVISVLSDPEYRIPPPA